MSDYTVRRQPAGRRVTRFGEIRSLCGAERNGHCDPNQPLAFERYLNIGAKILLADASLRVIHAGLRACGDHLQRFLRIRQPMVAAAPKLCSLSLGGQNMMTKTPRTPPKRYAAFISYSHADEDIGDWLHKRLENYEVPPALRGRAIAGGTVGKRLGKVFRDRAELSATHDLAGEIRDALERSDALIVLCSPRSCGSAYVHEEIRQFKARSGATRVFAAIVEGEPHAAGKPGATAADECFPRALLYRVGDDGQVCDQLEQTEPIAADFRESKDGRANGFLKIVAGLLDVGLDELVEREKQAERRRRRLANLIASSMSVLALLAIVGGYSATRLLANLNMRTSNTLAEFARRAFDNGDIESALRYSLAGLNGANWALIGFDASAAEVQLRRAASSTSRIRAMRGSSSALAFSPDGQTLIAAGGRQIELWDGLTGESKHSALEFESDVNDVAYSPDGAIFATAESSGMVQLWNARTFERIGAPVVTGGVVLAVAFSPDGRLLAIATGDKDLEGVSQDSERAERPGAVQFWDVPTRTSVGRPLQLRGSVLAIAFSLDGAILATGDAAGTARFWSVMSRTAVGTAMRHLGPVTAVEFTDSHALATVSLDGTLRLWSIPSGAPLMSDPAIEMTRPDNGVGLLALAIDRRGEQRRFAIGSGSTAARLLEFGVDVQRAPFRHSGEVRAVAFSPDGARLATGSSTGEVNLWDVSRAAPVRGRSGDAAAARIVAASPDGRLLATGGADGQVRLLDALTGNAIGSPLELNAPITALAFGEGNTLAIGAEDGSARAYRAGSEPTGPVVRQTGAVNSIALSRDGTLIATTAESGVARLWNARTGASVGAPMRHGESLGAIAFAPNGQSLATGGGGEVKVWNADAGAREPTLTLQTLKGDVLIADDIISLAFSPDGELLAAGGALGSAFIWEISTGEGVPGEMHMDASIFALAFSPDGRVLATGWGDRNAPWYSSAGLWDARTGEALPGPRRHHAAVVGAVAFTPDGQTLVAASGDGGVQVWPVPLALLLDRAELSVSVCASADIGFDTEFREDEFQAAPVLDPVLDADACRPPGLFQRLFRTFIRRQREEDYDSVRVYNWSHSRTTTTRGGEEED